jgi:hypothetical protein
MTAARLRRLARLEARRPAERPWTDPGPAAIELIHRCIDSFAAVEAGRASAIPRYGPHPQPSPAFEAIMRESDRIAARLVAERAKDGR